MERTLRLGEIADIVGGRLVQGDPDRLVNDIKPVELAGPQDLTWIVKPRYLQDLEGREVGGVLIRKGTDAGAHAAIECEHLDGSLSRALQAFLPPAGDDLQGVHPSAVVAPDAVMGEDVIVGPCAVIESGVSIGARSKILAGSFVGRDAIVGEDCVVYPQVYVGARVRLGNRVILYAGCKIGSDGFGYYQDEGLKKIPHIGTVVLEDDVEIGAGSCVDRAKCGETFIGRGTKVDDLVMIAHNVRIGAHCVLIGQCGVAGSTVIGDGVILAGQSGVADHIKIGRGARVAAQAGLIKDVPEGKDVLGNPPMETEAYYRYLKAVYRLSETTKQVRQMEKRLKKLEEGTS